MTQKMFKEILDKYLQGACTEAEQKFIDRWFENLHNDTLITLSENEALEARMLIAVRKRIFQSTLPTETLWIKRPWRLAAAAVVTLAMLAFAFAGLKPDMASLFADSGKHNIHSRIEVKNDSPEPLAVFLPDGSAITLQNGSSIQYDSIFVNATREVYLEGEAFFHVQRDEKRPFLVYANDVVTKVLGTSFTIIAFDQDENVTVKVKTGKVMVYTSSKKQTDIEPSAENILTPNQQIVFNRSEKKTARSLVEQPETIVPMDEVKHMHFEEAPVTEIWKALEKIYGMKINFDEAAFAKCTLTTSIAEGGIYNRLDIICKAIGATYTLEEDQIRITGAGCE